ncbi:MAG: hypothetical protein R3E13_00690 [Alphaproteobacteria bacterium]
MYDIKKNKLKNKYLIIAALSSLAVFPGSAQAGEEASPQPGFLKGYALSAYENEYAWRMSAGDYTTPVTAQVFEEAALDTGTQTLSTHEKRALTQDKDKNSSKNKAEDFAERIMEQMPYSRQLKSTWHLIDGDTDIYVEGLRVDRGNRGLSYQTSAMPFIGEVEGVKFTAEAGKDNKLKFESSVIPFVGHVEGLKFKSSVGKAAQVSVRYTVPLERLGL